MVNMVNDNKSVFGSWNIDAYYNTKIYHTCVIFERLLIQVCIGCEHNTFPLSGLHFAEASMIISYLLRTYCYCKCIIVFRNLILRKWTPNHFVGLQLCWYIHHLWEATQICGNIFSFVTIAKSLINEITGIDMLAGPTELGIIADDSVNPKFVALDLISQSEHSSDTFCYLITTSQQLAKSVSNILSELVPKVQRTKLVKSSLKNNGFIAICKNKSDMIKLSNILAPEHLQIMTPTVS